MSLRSDIKEAWVADLRNPANKQGTGVLRNQFNEYCCLGRLCEVLIKDFGYDIQAHQEDDDDSWYWYTYGNSTDYELPPIDLMAEIGLETDPEVSVYDPEEDIVNLNGLAELNDSGMTFAEIADLIEESDL